MLLSTRAFPSRPRGDKQNSSKAQLDGDWALSGVGCSLPFVGNEATRVRSHPRTWTGIHAGSEPWFAFELCSARLVQQ